MKLKFMSSIFLDKIINKEILIEFLFDNNDLSTTYNRVESINKIVTIGNNLIMSGDNIFLLSIDDIKSIFNIKFTIQISDNLFNLEYL